MDEEIKPKKALGQHWLHDIDVLTDIAELANIESTDFILEVGPGLGTLTEVILSYGVNVTAVEYDVELYKKLVKNKENLFSEDTDRLTLVNQDILKFDFRLMPTGYKVVANIPYYLTSNLIRILSENANQPLMIVLLIQKEVAERLCAGPGNMSMLSIWAQMYFDCELGPVVPAKLFTPPPKVDSQIVVMKRREVPLYMNAEKSELSRVIKSGFSNKRKTLHNSLSAGLHISKVEIEGLLNKAGIPSSSRPQELSIDQWLNIYEVLTANSENT